MTTSPELADVLTQLGDRVAPVSMALERTLPAPPEFADVFPEGGVVRGRVLSCVGSAASTVALRVAAAALGEGGWLAVVDVGELGLDAASELGVALERVVAIDSGIDRDGGEGEVWAEVVGAAADGFDVIMTRVPSVVRASTVRKVATRLQQRGVVMVVVGHRGPLPCDGVIEARGQRWDGVGSGWGHLRRRVVEVCASGRRLPGGRTRTVEWPWQPSAQPPASDETVGLVELSAVHLAEAAS